MTGLLTRTRHLLSHPQARRTFVLAVVALLIAAPLFVAAQIGQGSSVALAESGGKAWVALPGSGARTVVKLIDGPSGTEAASLEVTVAPADLTVDQAANTSAYLLDARAGRVARIDGATYDVSDWAPLGTPGGKRSDLRMLQGGGRAFIVDAKGHEARRIDPESLKPQGDVLPLGPALGEDQAVVDDDGRLLVVDPEGGKVTWFDGTKHGDVGKAGRTAHLVVVRGRAVLLDVAKRQLGQLGREGAPRWDCPRVRTDDPVRWLGSTTSNEVFAAVPRSGSFVVASVGRHDCDRFVSIKTESEQFDFGPLVQVGKYVFVPNRATGETTIIDSNDYTVAATVPGLTKKDQGPELVAQDGLVFFSDSGGNHFGVLALKGTWRGTDVKTHTQVKVITEPKASTGTASPSSNSSSSSSDSESSSGSPSSSLPPSGGSPPGDGTTKGPDKKDPALRPHIDSLDPPSTPVRFTVPATFSARISGGSVTTWNWTVASAGTVLDTSDQQGKFAYTFTDAGDPHFTISLTVSGPGGTDKKEVTIDVQSAPAAVNLTVTIVGLGSVFADGVACGGTCVLKSGVPSTLTAVASDSYVFSAWSGICGGSTPTCSVTIEEGSEVTATFVADEKPPVTDPPVTDPPFTDPPFTEPAPATVGPETASPLG